MKDLRSLVDYKERAVEVPEWETTVYLRSLNFRDRARIETINKDLDAKGDGALADIWAVIFSAYDKDGNRLFTEADFDVLADRDPHTIRKLMVPILDLNGLGPDALEKAKKGSSPTPDTASCTG